MIDGSEDPKVQIRREAFADAAKAVDEMCKKLEKDRTGKTPTSACERKILFTSETTARMIADLIRKMK